MNPESNQVPEYFKRILDLLEKRDILMQMCVIMYGDYFVENKEFWGSVTERQMGEVIEELIELGYVEDYDEDTNIEADRIFKKIFGDLPDKNLED